MYLLGLFLYTTLILTSIAAPIPCIQDVSCHPAAVHATHLFTHNHHSLTNSAPNNVVLKPFGGQLHQVDVQRYAGRGDRSLGGHSNLPQTRFTSHEVMHALTQIKDSEDWRVRPREVANPGQLVERQSGLDGRDFEEIETRDIEEFDASDVEEFERRGKLGFLFKIGKAIVNLFRHKNNNHKRLSSP